MHSSLYTMWERTLIIQQEEDNILSFLLIKVLCKSFLSISVGKIFKSDGTVLYSKWCNMSESLILVPPTSKCSDSTLYLYFWHFYRWIQSSAWVVDLTSFMTNSQRLLPHPACMSEVLKGEFRGIYNVCERIYCMWEVRRTSVFVCETRQSLPLNVAQLNFAAVHVKSVDRSVSTVLMGELGLRFMNVTVSARGNKGGKKEKGGRERKSPAKQIFLQELTTLSANQMESLTCKIPGWSAAETPSPT